MPAALLPSATLATAALVTLLAVYIAPYVGRNPAPPAPPPTDILDVIATEGVLRSDSWQLEPSHRAPTNPYTPEQAHTAWQQHLACSAERCRAKAAALRTLVDAGKLRLDIRAVR